MEKKSLVIAIESAINHSKEFPDILVRVMDKKNKRSVVCASEWIYKERVLSGWSTVASYKNGIKVD